MGITRSAVRLLLDESIKKKFQGSVLQLGRHGVYLTWEELKNCAELHQVQLSQITNINISNFDDLATLNFIDDKTLFSALGFELIDSCDASDFEGANYVFDLNKLVPEYMYNRYDVIVNFGTIEHIFHIPNALLNIHNMLKVGGRIIHVIPTSNYVDHGFYSLSPTLLYDYYEENNYSIQTAYLIEASGYHYDQTWKIYYYEPGCLDQFSVGKLLGRFATYFVASKEANSTGDVIPQQGFYKRIYKVT